MIAVADATQLPLPDRSVDLVFGSPPYVDARLYLEDGKNLGIARGCQEWVEWMLEVTKECLRVSRGPVCWVAAGKTKDRNYWPAVEGLIWECWKRGIHQYRPCYWSRDGIPGSGGDQWFKANIEYVTCFKGPGKLPWTDNTAMGQPCKYKTGGAMSYRHADGIRTNAIKHADGSSKPNNRSQGRPDLANPGNFVVADFTDDEIEWHEGHVIRVPVGGGLMGDELCHENEAPFPEKLAEHFIRSLCPPGGTVCDPFSGSGTTAKMDTVLGRQFAAFDLRPSQVELTKRRVALVQKALV